MLAVVLADLVDGDDAGVIEQGDGLGLVPEAAEFVVAGEESGPDHLQRNLAVEGDLAGLVDDAHAATAELPHNSELAPGLYRRGRRGHGRRGRRPWLGDWPIRAQARIREPPQLGDDGIGH